MSPSWRARPSRTASRSVSPKKDPIPIPKGSHAKEIKPGPTPNPTSIFKGDFRSKILNSEAHNQSSGITTRTLFLYRPSFENHGRLSSHRALTRLEQTPGKDLLDSKLQARTHLWDAPRLRGVRNVRSTTTVLRRFRGRIISLATDEDADRENNLDERDVADRGKDVNDVVARFCLDWGFLLHIGCTEIWQSSVCMPPGELKPTIPVAVSLAHMNSSELKSGAVRESH
ncbi:hypothetical protein B0H17DRAFT_1147628 [Mycena rosella]|uniref:Uncharacterized protein n=1 Tax=Mycena rosella TaxID=1033263 RepID=A0AAD7CLD6_MYCRO|nr:hypothetical protein B0H17DRAFT_1147628 [Mycena rosella]